MYRSIFLVVCCHTNTFTILHDQVKGKVFNEVVSVMSERLQWSAGVVGSLMIDHTWP